MTTPEFNKLTAQNFAARLAQANLWSKNNITNFVKKPQFDNKLKNVHENITSNETNHVVFENKLKQLQAFDSSLFIGQSYFNNNGAQLYLIRQPLYYTLKRLGDVEKVLSWKSKCFSAEKPTTPPPTDEKPTTPPPTGWKCNYFWGWYELICAYR